MVLNANEIEDSFYRFLNNDFPMEDFEQWLYSTSEIEEYLGSSKYLELVTFDFRQPAAKYELYKIIINYIGQGKFDTWLIKGLLQRLLDGTDDPREVMEYLYAMYCKGYEFLQYLAIDYILGIDEIPKLTQQDLWIEKEFFRLRKQLFETIEPLKEYIKIILEALETGEIKILEDQECFLSLNFLNKVNG